MNRSVWLAPLIFATLVSIGCQAGKFKVPEVPKFTGFKNPIKNPFKKKELDLAPPSKHFDADHDQLASAADSMKKQTEIPGEASAADKKLPSETAKPSEALAANKSGKANAGATTSDKATAKNAKPFQLPEVDPKLQPANAVVQKDLNTPTRKPYEFTPPENDTLNKAAEKLAADFDRVATTGSSQIGQDLNHAAAASQQFDAAKSVAKDSANELFAAAGNVLAPRTMTATVTPVNPNTSSGGAFQFEKPSPSSNVQSSEPARPQVAAKNEPLNLGANNPALQTGEQNANAMASAPSKQGGLPPVAFSPPATAPVTPEKISSPNPSSTNPNAAWSNASPAQTAAATTPNYPQTPFRPFAATPNGLAQNNASASQSNLNPNLRGEANSTNQASSSTEKTVESAPVRPVSHIAELPAELLNRSGQYAPGSTRVIAPNDGTIWR